MYVFIGAGKPLNTLSTPRKVGGDVLVYRHHGTTRPSSLAGIGRGWVGGREGGRGWGVGGALIVGTRCSSRQVTTQASFFFFFFSLFLILKRQSPDNLNFIRIFHQTNLKKRGKNKKYSKRYQLSYKGKSSHTFRCKC